MKFIIEKLNSYMTEMKAILNSEKISDDANDSQTVIPGHFLIGGSLNEMDEEGGVKGGNFGKRWSPEYLKELRTRSKRTSINEEDFRGSNGDNP